jgi:transcription elongation factor SPT6
LLGTDPTLQGEQTLDPFHPYGQVKRLRDKPVEEFVGTDQFLRLVQAEREGLISVRIGVRLCEGLTAL